MNKIAFFTLGVLVGSAATHYVSSHISKDRNMAINLNNNDIELSAIQHTYQSKPQPTNNDSKDIQITKNSDKATDIDLMIDELIANTENLFESSTYKDLAYLIRKDEKIAVEVRRKIINSNSYQEKYALVNLLAQDSSKENIDLAIDLIKSVGNESKQLGFELLRGMHIEDNQPTLTNALLDATYYESDPEFLTNVIFQLSENVLEPSTKAIAIDRVQSFLYSDDTILKARAIDGLSLLGDQQIISTIVKQHLSHADEKVRTSAISASFKLNQLDSDIISSLTNIIKNPEESENIRNMASAVLESQKSELSIREE